MTTTEQTDDEFTKRRQIDALAGEGAHHATNGARVFDEIRQRFGLNPTAIVREIAKHIPAMQSARMIMTIPSLGFAIESLRLCIGGASDEEEARLLASMSAIEGVKVIVRDKDGYIVDSPTTEQTRDALRPLGAGPPPPSWATIQRLFRESPSPLPDQAPAIECGVMLRGVPVTLMGSLSETSEGGLRLLSPDPSQERPIRPGTPMKMVEQFFDYEDVMVVAVRRQVTVDAPRIIQS